MKILVIVLVFLLFIPLLRGDDIPLRITLSTAVVGLGVADLALTIKGTRDLGLVEGNPLWRRMIEKRQYTTLWILELASSAVIVGGCNYLIGLKDEVPKVLGWTMLITAVAVRSWVVFHNLKLNRRASQCFALTYSFSF